MQYHGGKARQAKAIGQVLKANDRQKYLEPFVGAGWVLAQVAEHFHEVVASDIHTDVILMHQAVQAGWVPPCERSEDLWLSLKHAEPCALRGFVGHAWSWGGRFFRGYGRGKIGNGSESVMRKAKHFSGVKFAVADYRIWSPGTDTVVYCDPPYTQGEPLEQSKRFDNSAFWDTMEQWASQGAAVFVSETSAPVGWVQILNHSAVTGMGLDNEKFVRREGLYTKGVN